MGHHHVPPAYPPLIRSFSERLVRLPLGAWESSLAEVLRATLMQSPVQWDAVTGILNVLAVIAAYRGHNDAALGFCEAQIGLSKALSAEPGHAHRLAAVIQPWVNTIRLERWQKKVDSAIPLYRELAPQQRGMMGTLNARYGIGASLDALLRMDESGVYRIVLDNVYWIEYTRWLLATGQTLELQAQLQAGLNSKLSSYAHAGLLEVLLMYQVQIGAHGKARELLARLGRLHSDRNRLPFAVLELYLGYSCGEGWEPALAAVCGLTRSARYIQHDKFGLSLLCDIALVLRNFGAPPDAELGLLEQAYPLALAIDDEVSLYDVSARLLELDRLPSGGLPDRFRRSGYALVRKGLGLAPLPAVSGQASGTLLAAQRLSRLDIDGCLHALRIPDA